MEADITCRIVARVDGAARSRGRIQRRKSDRVGADSKSAGGAGTVAKAWGLSREDVTCHVTLLGGAFGRKVETGLCGRSGRAFKQLGKPVKVVWSREDDLHFDYYHSVAAMYMKAAIDEGGRPTGWLQRSVSAHWFAGRRERALRRPGHDGLGGRALGDPAHPHGERTGGSAYTDRLASFRRQCVPRVWRALLCRRIGGAGGARSRGISARSDW